MNIKSNVQESDFPGLVALLVRKLGGEVTITDEELDRQVDCTVSAEGSVEGLTLTYTEGHGYEGSV